MRKITIVTGLALVVGLLAPPPALALDDDIHTKKLRKEVNAAGILSHEHALQRIANENGGNRAAGTAGYDESADYVAKKLENSGFDVEMQAFEFPYFFELAPSLVEQVSPDEVTYESVTMTYSGTGDITGAVVPTNDVIIPPLPDPGSTSGCEPEDFEPADPVEPQVALIQRGTCFFIDKALNAQAAGYDAVLIFNEGQEGRTELLTGTLGAPVDFPVVGLSFDDGAALYEASQAGETVVHVVTSTESETRTTHNVIADLPGGKKKETVVIGAHLDSVSTGPGINDNGSGSMTILEVAQEIAQLDINYRRHLRFAFWGAEELSLLGSQYYVDTLKDSQLNKIYANLNFDMLASPNYVRFVYDGDGSATDPAGPPGSDELEALFTDYFASQDLASSETAFSGRSDYGPFIAVGIPAGGLFSGAEGVKTEEEAAIYGGTAGVAYDVCYHLACDTVDNVNSTALGEMGDAVADSVLTMARSKTGLYDDSIRPERVPVPTETFDYWGGLVR